MIDQLKRAAANAQRGADAGSGNALQDILNDPRGLAAGAGVGALAGLLLSGGKPKKLAKNAVKIGGVALVGGLAYKAWRNWQANNTAAPAGAPAEELFIPSRPEEQAALGRVLAKAMINAAKADGVVSQVERARIRDNLVELGVDDRDIAFAEREIDAPFDIESVVREATSPTLAAEIYAASLLAIDPNGRAELGYLSLLASRLELEPTLVKEIHASANSGEALSAPSAA